MDDTASLLALADRMLWITALVSAPVLLAALAVGIVIGIIQAATSVNEQTLTFLPKLAITALVLVVFGASMMGLIADFTQEIFATIAGGHPVIGLTFGFGALEAELWKLLFVMTRIGAALLAAPFFGAGTVPVQVRVAITGAISVLVCTWLPVQVPPALLSVQGILAIFGEVLIGLTLGFVLQMCFAAPVIAAEQIGGAMGLSLATAVDPVSGAQSPALGQYFTVLLTLIFLGLGGHLHFIDLVIDSYTAFPPGQAWLGPERIETVLGFGTDMFVAALAIALPVTLVLLLVQVLTGVISRSAPALNLFAVGLPMGVLAGLAALILAVPLLIEQFGDLSAQGLEQVGSLLTR